MYAHQSLGGLYKDNNIIVSSFHWTIFKGTFCFSDGGRVTMLKRFNPFGYLLNLKRVDVSMNELNFKKIPLWILSYDVQGKNKIALKMWSTVFIYQ